MLHFGCNDTESCCVCYSLTCKSMSYHMKGRLTVMAKEMQFVHPKRHGELENVYCGCYYTMLCLLKYGI